MVGEAVFNTSLTGYQEICVAPFQTLTIGLTIDLLEVTVKSGPGVDGRAVGEYRRADAAGAQSVQSAYEGGRPP